MATKTCTATHISPTANGDVQVRCVKTADHVQRGDPQHEAWIGPFPVRWL